MIEKFKAFSVKPADAAADIALINKLAVKELTRKRFTAFPWCSATMM